MLAVLLLIYAHNSVDRVALGLLLQSVKSDLRLSDTELGALTGIAFALFYSLMGIPIARWADRGNRITIISSATAIWSVMVAACGFAQTFTHLLLIRMGVGIGEAGCAPPSHSLIADAFDRFERPWAVSIFVMAGPLGMLIGYLPTGWLNEAYGWRVTFILLGIPGVALAALAALTLRDPWRSRPPIVAATIGDSPSPLSRTLRDTLRELGANRTFVCLLLAFSSQAFFGFGILQWMPSFFERSHRLSTGEIGTWFALIYGVGGIAGTYAGGALATRFANGNEKLQLRVAALSFLIFAAFSAAVYVVDDYHIAMAALALATIGGCMANGPIFSTMQLVVPDHSRATAVATAFLLANLIGLGLGPLAAGAVSDTLSSIAGMQSLRWALLALCPGYLISVWLLWKAGRSVTADIERNQCPLAESGTDIIQQQDTKAAT